MRLLKSDLLHYLPTLVEKGRKSHSRQTDIAQTRFAYANYYTYYTSDRNPITCIKNKLKPTKWMD